MSPAPLAQNITVTSQVAKLQESAVLKQDSLTVIGVFIFLSTSKGDAWLLELTDMDAVRVASNGEKIDVDIEESTETIEINWSHRFSIDKNMFTVTAYADNTIESFDNYPVSIIKDALRNIRKNFSSELLDSIHVDNKGKK